MSSAESTAIERGFDRRYAYTLVGAFSFGWLVFSADMSMLSPLLPLVRAEFGLSGTAAGLLTWAFTLPYLLMQIPSGVLGDRLGAKRMLVVMTLLSALGFIALGLWSFALTAFVVFAVLHRIGSGVYYPTAFGVVSGALPASLRGRASGFLVMGMALGAAVGLALAVPLYELGGNDWRFPFLAFGVLTLTLPAIFQVTMRHSPPSRKAVTGGIAAVLRDRSLVALFAINFCTNFSYTVNGTWGPSLLSGERGLSLATAGFFAALVNLVGFPSGMVAGLLSDRLGRQRMTLLLFLIAGVSLAGLAIFGNPVLILVATVAFGLTGKWSSDGVLAAWMGDHVQTKYPASSNTVYGVNNTARMTGALLAPPVAGVLLDYTGTLATGFFVAAAVLIIAGCLAPLVAERAGGGRD